MDDDITDGGAPPRRSITGRFSSYDHRLSALEGYVIADQAQWRLIKWALGLILGSVLALATWMVYTTISSQHALAEQGRVTAQHADLPVHTRTPETVADIRETMGEIRVELREWRANLTERLERIEANQKQARRR